MSHLAVALGVTAPVRSGHNTAPHWSLSLVLLALYLVHSRSPYSRPTMAHGPCIHAQHWTLLSLVDPQ